MKECTETPSDDKANKGGSLLSALTGLVMPSFDEVVEAWNSQADDWNQWHTLSDDEMVEWAVKCCKNRYMDRYEIHHASSRHMAWIRAAIRGGADDVKLGEIVRLRLA